jgi:hypothetical protein
MLSRLTMLFFLLVHLPQNLFAVEDPIFYSGFENTGTTPPPVNYVATDDQFGAGEVFGTYLKTHADDGDVQQFVEKISAKRAK